MMKNQPNSFFALLHVVFLVTSASGGAFQDEARVAGLTSGVRKRVYRNALGWISQVTENEGGVPATNTFYRYDAAGRLLGVWQGAAFCMTGRTL